MTDITTIQGTCAPRFQAVRDELAKNFQERGEVGASVCAIVDGEVVVDLHGGVADPATGRPWTADTVSVVWSSTKGALALCAHMLADRGQLDLGAPVGAYWPELGRGAKERITVRMLLSHQAGLPAIRATIPEGGLYDWERMIAMLEAEELFWEPGTRHGYHGLTIGYLVGEVIRRVSGQTVGAFFQSEVARPLGLDFWIGLPESEEARVSPIIPPDPPTGDPGPFFRAAMTDPTSLQALMLTNVGGHFNPGAWDSRAAHAAEIPAAGGITNARGLAGMYAPLSLGGALGKVRLVSEAAITDMAAVQSASDVDAMLLLQSRFTLGFMKSVDNRRRAVGDGSSTLLSEEAFGHPGMGGSIGFADPGARLSFGYVMNKQGPGVGLNERGQRLVDAVYRTLGYEAPRGTWIGPRRR